VFNRDLINTEELVSFINNVIVETKEKERYDKVVKVVKKLAENNLFVKSEKCKWKIRKIGFLDGLEDVVATTRLSRSNDLTNE